MRNLFNRLTQRVRDCLIAGVVGLGIGSFLVGPAALALVIPQQFAPRYFQTQQVHYIRVTVAFNSCVPNGACSFKIGAVPYNAFLSKVDTLTTTAWNSTTNLLALGTASGGAQIRAATTIAAAANTIDTGFAGVGISVTGNGITSTGADGGFDVWATLSLTGATPTAGNTIVVLEYYAPNDGSCIAVPLGGSAPAC